MLGWLESDGPGRIIRETGQSNLFSRYCFCFPRSLQPKSSIDPLLSTATAASTDKAQALQFQLLPLLSSFVSYQFSYQKS